MEAGTVLMVDYHPEVLHISGVALARHSYRTLTALSGEIALDVLEAMGPVDLVLTEVLLPGGLSGVALTGRIQERYPQTTVMLMTGFTEEKLDPEIPLLRKPFTPSILIQRVQAALTDSRAITASLRQTFDTNTTLQNELQSAASAVRETLRVSRNKRIARFCERLREAGAVVPVILLADDDKAFRFAVRTFLTGLGFIVMEAAGGEEALAMSRRYQGRIDAVIAQIGMPPLSGVALAEELKAKRPLMGIVYVSSEDRALPHPALRKPLDMDDLLAMLIMVLPQT
jgi:DNA-binding response OmpR family regulator